MDRATTGAWFDLCATDAGVRAAGRGGKAVRTGKGFRDSSFSRRGTIRRRMAHKLLLGACVVRGMYAGLAFSLSCELCRYMPRSLRAER